MGRQFFRVPIHKRLSLQGSGDDGSVDGRRQQRAGETIAPGIGLVQARRIAVAAQLGRFHSRNRGRHLAG